MPAHHVIDAYALTISELTTPDGKKLPVLDIQLMTRSDPDQTEAHRWPNLRLRPRDLEELIARLTEVQRRLLTGDHTGPGRAH